MLRSRIVAVLLLCLGCASSGEGLLGPDAVERDGLSYSLRIARAESDPAALIVEMSIHNPGLRSRRLAVNGWTPLYVRIHRASDDSLMVVSPSGGPRPLGGLDIPAFGLTRVSRTVTASELSALPNGSYRFSAVLTSDAEVTLDRTVRLPLGGLR